MSPQMLLITAIIADELRVNPRTTVNDEADERLTNSIRKHGILQPIGVRRDGNVFRLVWGSRRLRCAGLAGLEKVPSVVLDREMTETEYKLLAWAENHARENLTGAEQAEFIESLAQAEPGWTQDQLAAALGLSSPSVSQYRAAVGAHPEVWQAFKAKRISLTAIYELSQLPPDEQPAALRSRLDKPKARKGRKPAAESTERVKRISVQLGGATVTVARKQLDMQSLIGTLKALLKEAKDAESQGVQISTLGKLLNEKAGKAVVS